MFQFKGLLLLGLSLWATTPPLDAAAETAIDESVNATVGIHPMVSLECTSVNFGVWRSPPRNSGGATRIMLDVDYPDSEPRIFMNTHMARASDHSSWAPAFGICTLTQSRAPDHSSATITISNDRWLKITPDGDTFQNIANGRSGYGILVDVYVPSMVTIINGSATFRVGGGMTIPQRIEEGDYGGYRTTVRPIITVDDRMR